jgi:hypothetical protein
MIQLLPGRLRKKMFAIRSRIEWLVQHVRLVQSLMILPRKKKAKKPKPKDSLTTQKTPGQAAAGYALQRHWFHHCRQPQTLWRCKCHPFLRRPSHEPMRRQFCPDSPSFGHRRFGTGRTNFGRVWYANGGRIMASRPGGSAAKHDFSIVLNTPFFPGLGEMNNREQ